MAITKEVILNKIEMVGTQRTAQLQYITIIKEDGDYLHEYFSRTRAIRRRIIDAGQDTGEPDFGRGKTWLKCYILRIDSKFKILIGPW